MKKVWGILVCLMYLVGVVGIDIHVDHHEGRTYVVSLLSDTSCEKIHPEDVCSCCEHHHHNEEEGFCDCEDDCQNITDFLVITGDGAGDHQIDFAPLSSPAFEGALPSSCSEIQIFASPACKYSGQFRKAPPRENLSRICVLRV